MEKLRSGILQALVIGAIAVAVGLAFNALSDNGIDPFRKIDEVPVLDDFQQDMSGGIRMIDIGEFKAMLDGGMTVIDARTKDEYESGHIPGAFHMDYYEFMRYLDQVTPYLGYEEEFAIYCNGPHCEDSEMLARELFALGYRKIAVFRGGIEGWCGAGFSLETDTGEEY
ncbi:MAG TPA: rhodanese-like domain-containing protein [Candidatus Krumholzibacterium sp.]|nr:rhodanese-like domain-containing protein [Candidatus Krumholzibacterium sp.]